MLDRFEEKYEDQIPDWYWDLTIALASARRRYFPFYYRWRQDRQTKAKFGFLPKVGDWVNDCRNENVQIVSIDPNGDDVVCSNGNACSLWHCCSPVEDA